MEKHGDMWRVDYPDDTGPSHAPLSLAPTETEAAPMVTDSEFVYVNRYGEDVAPDDPDAQTKFAPAELEMLRKGGFFPKRDGQVDDARDESAGTPVLNSGIGQVDEDADLVDAKSVDASTAAEDDETADAPPAAATVKHGKR